MSPSTNLYRRNNGIYVVRISVPHRFRRYAGQCEIHTSTSTNVLSEAKQRAAKLLSVWHQVLLEYEQMDHRSLSHSAPLTAGVGMISIADFSQAIGLTVNHLVQTLINRNLPVFWRSVKQRGYYVKNIHDVEIDPSTGGHIVDSAKALGIEDIADGLFRPFDTIHTLRSLIAFGSSEDEAAFRATGAATWFFDIPAVKITPENLLINKVHAESLRSDWLSKCPPPAAPASMLPPEPVNEYVHRKYYARTLSWLCERHIEFRKKGKVTESALQGTRDYFAFLIEVMGDERLEKVDRDFFYEFESRLRLIPAQRNLVKAKYNVDNIEQLIEISDVKGLPLMTDDSVRKYLSGVFVSIKWALGAGIFIRSPYDNFLPNKPKTIMDQELADPFDEKRLWDIFSQSWFSNGTAKRNSKGRFHQYRPFHYWAPLIGLFTGARVNEIAQMSLADVVEDNGVYYFNIEDDEEVGKKLKTVNSRRKIPIHPKLIELGLVEYINALKKLGYKRVFPELKPHLTKSYGRPVSSWFNESLLANRLGVVRDRKQSFHSFRHTAVTALKAHNVSPEIRAQILGHVRGENETTGRYSKDMVPAHITPVIELLDFRLPPIAPFIISDGLDALTDALRMKRGVGNKTKS